MQYINPLPFDLAPPRVSFEFFPPKNDEMEKQLWNCIQRLAPLNPEFVSVTYGAGGTTRERTHATVEKILRETTLTPAAHLTCVGQSRGEIDDIARRYWTGGVRHIVALRGDGHQPAADGYQDAAELVSGLVKIAPFDITVAAYAETHPLAESPIADLENLKRKLDAGGGSASAITNYFFDNNKFLRFRDLCAAAGITAPIIPGIMPVTNYNQIVKFSAVSGVKIPPWLARFFDGVEDVVETRRMIAVAVASEQVRHLQANGVDQFHFYTLNRPELTFSLCHILGIKPVSA